MSSCGSGNIIPLFLEDSKKELKGAGENQDETVPKTTVIGVEAYGGCFQKKGESGNYSKWVVKKSRGDPEDLKSVSGTRSAGQGGPLEKRRAGVILATDSSKKGRGGVVQR